MFVEINNSDLSVVEIDKEIKVRRNRDGKFTPELAMWVLSKTNHFANIKFVIKNIKQRPQEEWGEYKDFVLSCVDGREQSEKAIEDLLELVKHGGYEEEFNKVNEKNKVYDKEICKSVDVCSVEELKDAIAKGMFVNRADLTTPKYHEVYLRNLDLSKVYKMTCRGEAEWFLSGSILPIHLSLDVKKANLDECDFKNVSSLSCCNSFSGEIEVNMNKAKNLSSDLDLTGIDDLSLSACDLSGFEELKFKEYARVNLSRAYNFPKIVDGTEFDLDISLYGSDLSGVEKLYLNKNAKLAEAKNLPKTMSFMYMDNVLLDGCDLSGVEEISLVTCKNVSMNGCKNLPKSMDLSSCLNASFYEADFSGVENFVVCKEELGLNSARNLPKVLDLRNCNKISFSETKLSGVEEIWFKQGAEVCFWGARELPKKIDLSMCESVLLQSCDMTGVEIIRFRDEKQMNCFMYKSLNFGGEIKYKPFDNLSYKFKEGAVRAMQKIYDIGD